MVLLTLKNLQQQTFQVEIDVTASVKELKEKIEKDRGKEYPAVGQKLIYAGKILQDDNKLESYNMDTNKFLVIMVTKPKTSPPPPEADTDDTTTPATTEAMDTTAASSAATAATTSTSTATTTASSGGSTSTTDTSTTDTTSAANTHTSSAESFLVMGDEFNKMVENIMEMGYERRMVERALRASFNNPYTAVQYLVDGIPDNLGDTEPPVGGGGGGDDGDAPGDGERSGTGGSGGDGGDAPSGGDAGGRSTTILLTQQDRDAIDRLRGLGNFPEELVVQAYFACEKNENLAAEFLFSQAWD